MQMMLPRKGAPSGEAQRARCPVEPVLVITFLSADADVSKASPTK